MTAIISVGQYISYVIAVWGYFYFGDGENCKWAYNVIFHSPIFF